MPESTTTTARSHPITLAPWEVRALRAGRKTQFRVPIEPQPHPYTDRWYQDRATQKWMPDGTDPNTGGGFGGHWREAPVKIGDILRCREHFMADPPRDGSWQHYGSQFEMADIPMRFRSPEHVIYRADPQWAEHQTWAWLPPSRMPRWASRFRLPVVSVRPERLRSMSWEDAVAEGVEWNTGPTRADHTNPIGAFRSAWRERYGKKYPAESNPWLWRYEVEASKP